MEKLSIVLNVMVEITMMKTVAKIATNKEKK